MKSAEPFILKNVSTQSVLEKSFQCQITCQIACQEIYQIISERYLYTYSESIFQTYSGTL